MQLNIRISRTKLNPIHNLRYILQMAKGMKCNLYYLSNETKCLYGTYDEPYAIHEAPVEFEINSDLVFCYDLVDKSIVDANGDIDYFIPYKFPWAAIPVKYWDSYVNGDIYEWYHPDNGTRYLVNDKDNEFIDYIIIIRMNQTYQSYIPLISQVGYMIEKLNGSDIEGPYTFRDMHRHPLIQQVFRGKVADGRRLMTLASPDGRLVTFYIFKTLFSLNINDVLSLDIFFDRTNSCVNILVFKPLKKKRPIGIDISFQERIYCSILNLTNSRN